MQLVPIIPQPKIGIEDKLEVKSVAALKAAKPVQEGVLPPVSELTQKSTAQNYAVIHQDVKPQLPAQVERRIVSRRLRHAGILEELRSTIDRRRHRIDENV